MTQRTNHKKRIDGQEAEGNHIRRAKG